MSVSCVFPCLNCNVARVCVCVCVCVCVRVRLHIDLVLCAFPRQKPFKHLRIPMFMAFLPLVAAPQQKQWTILVACAAAFEEVFVMSEGAAIDSSEEDGAAPTLPEEPPANIVDNGPGNAAPSPHREGEEEKVQDQALEQAPDSRSELSPVGGQCDSPCSPRGLDRQWLQFDVTDKDDIWPRLYSSSGCIGVASIPFGAGHSLLGDVHARARGGR